VVRITLPPNKQFAMAGGVNKQPGKGHKEEVRDVVSQSKIFGFADAEGDLISSENASATHEIIEQPDNHTDHPQLKQESHELLYKLMGGMICPIPKYNFQGG
jgi:hypothetical protein